MSNQRNGISRRALIRSTPVHMGALALLGCGASEKASASIETANTTGIDAPYTDPVLDTLHLVDPEYRDALAQAPLFSVGDTTLAETRVMMQSREPEALTGERTAIGSETADVLVYRPSEPGPGPLPIIYYIHGGGYIIGTAAGADAYCAAMADRAGAVVVSVEYRLAPETPFPGPQEDCYAGLKWTYDNAGALGGNPDRIAVMGHSAGGGLAASLGLMARDRREVPVKLQILIYPMLDYRTGTAAQPVDNLNAGQFVWTRAYNRFGWSSLRGDYAMDDERMGYFSPTHAATLAGLPPTFIMTGALDLFLEEDVAYGLRLTRDGVPTECLVYPGLAHAFDANPATKATKRFQTDLYAAFDRWL